MQDSICLHLPGHSVGKKRDVRRSGARISHDISMRIIISNVSIAVFLSEWKVLFEDGQQFLGWRTGTSWRNNFRITDVKHAGYFFPRLHANRLAE